MWKSMWKKAVNYVAAESMNRHGDLGDVLLLEQVHRLKELIVGHAIGLGGRAKLRNVLAKSESTARFGDLFDGAGLELVYQTFVAQNKNKIYVLV